MLLFSLCVSFIHGLGVFPVADNPGLETTSDNVLSQLTLLDGDMSALWLSLVTIGGVTALGLAYLTHSVTPIGIHLFGTVFWTAYIRTSSILNTGGYIPADFLLIATVGMIFIFIAAIIGMLTGSG